MASLFEEMMSRSRVGKSSKKTESRKIKINKIKVESRRIFEENEFDELEKEFEIPEVENETEDDIVLVIDPEIGPEDEIPEEAAEELVGDFVYKCPVCGSNYVCDCENVENESLEVDENGIPVECPICGDDADQILVGEIAPAEEAGEEDDLDLMDVDDAETPDEFEDEDIVEDEEEVVESVKKRPIRKTRKTESLSEQDYLDIVDQIMYSEDRGSSLGPSGAYEFTNDDDEVVGVVINAGPEDQRYIANKYGLTKYNRTYGYWYESNRSRKKEGCSNDRPFNEDFDEVTTPADDFELDIVTPEVEEDDTPEVAIDAETVEIHFDEKKFESLMNRFLRENYKTPAMFKVRNVTLGRRSKTLKIEYVLRSRKGMKRGVLVDSKFNFKTMNLRDMSRTFTESKSRLPQFKVELLGRSSRRIVPKSMKYDFKKRVNESLYRVYGVSRLARSKKLSESLNRDEVVKWLSSLNCPYNIEGYDIKIPHYILSRFKDKYGQYDRVDRRIGSKTLEWDLSDSGSVYTYW